jgi:hypothetical protein
VQQREHRQGEKEYGADAGGKVVSGQQQDQHQGGGDPQDG